MPHKLEDHPPAWERGRLAAARYCSASPNFIKALEDAGHLVPLRLNTRVFYYRRTDLDAALQKRAAEKVGAS